MSLSFRWSDTNENIILNFRISILRTEPLNLTRPSLRSCDADQRGGWQKKLPVIWVTASSDVTQWLRCIVGDVGSRFTTGRRMWGIKGDISVLMCWLLFVFIEIINQQTATQNPLTTLPTMHLSHWVTSLEAVYQMTGIFVWRHWRLYTTFILHN